VLSARFSPDGQHIVTTSTDRTARVWQPEGGELIRILKSHEGDLSTAALSPDEERIAAVPPESDTAEIWDVKSGRVLAILRGHAAYVQSAEFSPDRQRVVTAAWDNTSRVWSADDGDVLAIL
jgi:WD40 repeat protein